MKKQQQEGNSYDKILKENIAAIFFPLMEKYLNIKIISSETLDAKLQSTIEREADFIRLIKTDKKEEFILQLEFQSANDPDMIYRIKEYDAIIQRKYKKRIRHYVVFLGMQKVSMRTQLKPEEIFTGFDILNISELNFNEMIESQLPEEIVMAILSDFRGKEPERIIRLVVNKLQRLSQSEKKLSKFITQLEVLSKLRKLEEITVKTIETMPIHYDITTDYVYNRGLDVGVTLGMEKGIEKGMEKGRAKERVEREIERRATILKLLLDGILSREQIAHYFDLPVDVILEIQKEMEDGKF